MAIVRAACWMIGVLCVVSLGLSVIPGLLGDVVLFAIVFVLPFGLGLAAVSVVWLIALACRTGRQRESRRESIAGRCLGVTSVVVVVTFILLATKTPQRVAFAGCRDQFERLIAGKGEPRIGPYRVEQCRRDRRGGTYVRVYSGYDGIGPDIMSHGFCHQPNPDGSPFGAKGYRLTDLGDGWFVFQASNDWF